jgi:hypothetical protein
MLPSAPTVVADQADAAAGNVAISQGKGKGKEKGKGKAKSGGGGGGGGASGGGKGLAGLLKDGAIIGVADMDDGPDDMRTAADRGDCVVWDWMGVMDSSGRGGGGGGSGGKKQRRLEEGVKIRVDFGGDGNGGGGGDGDELQDGGDDGPVVPNSCKGGWGWEVGEINANEF